ncbi:hypothetical protein PCE1_003930 [Barthelona sp. PCE]
MLARARHVEARGEIPDFGLAYVVGNRCSKSAILTVSEDQEQYASGCGTRKPANWPYRFRRYSMIPSSNMKIASPVILFDHKRDYLQNMDQEGFRPDGIHGTRVEGSPEPVQTTGNAENGVSFEKKKDSCCDGSAAISNSEDVVLVSLRSLNTKKWAQIVNMKKTFLVVMQNDSKGVRPSRSACIGCVDALLQAQKRPNNFEQNSNSKTSTVMVLSLFPCPGPPQEALSTYSSREFLLQMHDAGILLFYSRFQPWQDTTSSFVRVFYPMGPPAGMRHLYNHAISLYNFQSISSRFAAIFR